MPGTCLHRQVSPLVRVGGVVDGVPDQNGLIARRHHEGGRFRVDKSPREPDAGDERLIGMFGVDLHRERVEGGRLLHVFVLRVLTDWFNPKDDSTEDAEWDLIGGAF